MPKISDARRDARRNQILEAARRAFAAKGYQHTSMADIIAETGLSTGAIYGHFEGKGELFKAAARFVMARRTADLVAAAAEGDPPSPAEVLDIMLTGLQADGLDLRLLVQLWGESTVDPEVRDVVNTAVRSLRGAFQDALRRWYEADPERRAPDGVDVAVEQVLPVFLGLGQGFIVQAVILDDFDPQVYLDGAHRILPH